MATENTSNSEFDLPNQESALSNTSSKYTEKSIKTLEPREHIRLRPGMYVGKLGSGKHSDDGIYVLIKEIIDNSIDEFRMKAGHLINILLEDNKVSIRDYGRGIPLGSIIDAVSKMNTGGKYDNEAFVKSVGLNGVGSKAVNALSSFFKAQSFRDGQTKRADFSQGVLVKEYDLEETKEANGTLIEFIPDADPSIFGEYHYNEEFIERMLRSYSYLNPGLTIMFNGKKFYSKRGLLDLLHENITSEPLYPIIHLKSDDIEIAFTHSSQYGEEYYSFVNGQHTTQGGTHQSAFREAIGRTIKEFYDKNGIELADIRNGFVGAISISVMDPTFESQTKIRLGSKEMGPKGPTIQKFINDFIGKEVDNFLHREPEIAETMLQKILESGKERKAIAGVTKEARLRAKKINLHNKKLRDCRIHFNSTTGKSELREQSSIFITEGDSASGSITKTRNNQTQAVFSLRGKPLNCYGKTKKFVYENEEFNLLQAALNIEDGLEKLRYNKVIIATDADDDGMHIRLLLLTFFLQFFPDLVKKGHVYVLQTPLFRVRNKKETRYCYTEEERLDAMASLGRHPEITRFKGLGEISPEEFRHFIGKDMRLDQVQLRKEDLVSNLLEFYMGKNTQDRQDFIVENLVIEENDIDV